MRGKKMLALMLAGALSITTFLTGCGKDKETSSNTLKDADQYVNYVFNSDLKTADPSLNDDTYGGMVLTDTLEPLTRVIVKEDGSEVIEPAGAEKWEISDDGLTYTFHIRDFNWEDGQKVTAQQYAYSLMRTLNPDTGSSYSSILYNIKNAKEYNGKTVKPEDVGISTPDDKTLVITLASPTPHFITLTNFTIFVPQRQDIIEKYGKTFGAEANTLLSCGPFKMTEWLHDSKIVLSKNNTYWDKDKVKLNTVTIKVIKDEESRYQELYTGGIDNAPVAKTDWIDKFKEAGRYTFIEKPQPTTLYAIFNQKTEINGVKFFSNPKVRKAFSAAFDRQEICDLIYEGTMVPAKGWIPTKLQLGDKEFREIAGFDPVTKLLDEVKDPKALLIEGLKELGADPDPSKYTVKYLVGNTTASGKKNAEVYQQRLQNNLGIKVEIEQVESAVKSNRVQSLDYDFTVYAWAGDYNDPSTFMNMWITTAPNFPTGYANTHYDELITEAGLISDNAKRLELYKEAEKLLVYDDAAITPLAFAINVQFWNKSVKNVMMPTFGSIAELKYAYVEARN